MYSRLSVWLGLLAAAAILDLVSPLWHQPVAAIVKGRHGSFDDPVPVEPDRSTLRTPDELVAIAPDGVRLYYVKRSAALKDKLRATTADDVPLWTMDFQGPYVRVLAHPRQPIVFVLSDQRLIAVSRSTGSVLWYVITNDRPENVDDGPYQDRWMLQTLAVTPRGDICGAGWRIVCFTAQGKLLWLVAANAEHGRLLAVENRIFTSSSSTFTARTIDGEVVGESTHAFARAVDLERKVVYATFESSSSVVALTFDAKELWRVELQGSRDPTDPKSFGLVVGNDGTVYVSTGALVAISPAGKILWTFKPTDFLTIEPMMDVNGDVLIASSRWVFALKPDGTLRWRADAKSDYPGRKVIGRYPPRLTAVDERGVYIKAYASDVFIARPKGEGTR